MSKFSSSNCTTIFCSSIFEQETKIVRCKMPTTCHNQNYAILTQNNIHLLIREPRLKDTLRKNLHNSGHATGKTRCAINDCISVGRRQVKVTIMAEIIDYFHECTIILWPKLIIIIIITSYQERFLLNTELKFLDSEALSFITNNKNDNIFNKGIRYSTFCIYRYAMTISGQE